MQMKELFARAIYFVHEPYAMETFISARVPFTPQYRASWKPSHTISRWEKENTSLLIRSTLQTELAKTLNQSCRLAKISHPYAITASTAITLLPITLLRYYHSTHAHNTYLIS